LLKIIKIDWTGS